jgi:hypothetical protein
MIAGKDTEDFVAEVVSLLVEEIDSILCDFVGVANGCHFAVTTNAPPAEVVKLPLNLLAPASGQVCCKGKIRIGLRWLVLSSLCGRIRHCITSPLKSSGGVRHPQATHLARVAFDEMHPGGCQQKWQEAEISEKH